MGCGASGRMDVMNRDVLETVLTPKKMERLSKKGIDINNMEGVPFFKSKLFMKES
jgi:hypothetical protein